LKGFLSKLGYNRFFKVFSVNGLVVIGKLASSFIVSKVSAIYLGPSGYAIVGNFKNALQGVLGITASGFESGLIKYISENKDDKKQVKIITVSAFIFSVVISFVVGVFLFFLSKHLALFILKDSSLTFIFRYLALLLPLVSLNFLILYIINGLQKFKVYTILITVTNILNAVITFFLIYYFRLSGALIASILVPVLSFIAGILIKDVRIIFLDALLNLNKISVHFFKSISVYIAMAIYSSILISLCYLLIRNGIINRLDVTTAGLWEAMNKISSFYMIFFSSLFTLYLLPLLASNKTVSGYVEIMRTYFKYLIPLIIILFMGILFFREILIRLFLTNEFRTIEQFFYLQLIGDFIKIIAFSFAYQFHAKKMVASYFISDAILYGSFYILSAFLLKHFSLQGIFYAYIGSTVLYLISVCLFVFFNRTKYLKSENQSI
jgi:PST family polysaccharide transporter